MNKQKTIANEITIAGFGLHTAKKANLTFKPAEVDSGVRFVRVDLPGKPVIKAEIDSSSFSYSKSPRRTSIGTEGINLYTIEHLMASLAGLGIDNIIIEVDSEEVPGLDGSSINFLESLLKAGLVEQDKERHFYSIKEPIFVEDEHSSIMVIPSSDFKISYTLSYNHPLLKSQFMEIAFKEGVFEKELASARTFCLEDEASDLKQQGLGQGANYENTLVLGKSGVVNNKLRYQDEFVRHKILDLMGDLYLLGCPIRGHVIALKSGHLLNMKLVRKIKEQKDRYSLGGVGNYSKKDVPSEGGFDVEEIKKVLPHREPFLFVDRILSVEKGKSVVGIKNVTINDYFFKGHFPGKPVMPGVIIIEAMAQVGGVMMLSLEENKGKLAYFMAADNIKFRKTVIPGDQLVFKVEAVKVKSKTGQVRGEALVDGKVVAEADIIFVLSDPV